MCRLKSVIPTPLVSCLLLSSLAPFSALPARAALALHLSEAASCCCSRGKFVLQGTSRSVCPVNIEARAVCVQSTFVMRCGMVSARRAGHGHPGEDVLGYHVIAVNSNISRPSSKRPSSQQSAPPLGRRAEALKQPPCSWQRAFAAHILLWEHIYGCKRVLQASRHASRACRHSA